MKGYSSEIFQEKFYSDKIIQSTPAGNFFPGNFPNKLENKQSTRGVLKKNRVPKICSKRVLQFRK